MITSIVLLLLVGSAVVVESDDGYKPKCVPGLDCDTKQIDKEGTTSPTANATNYVDENAAGNALEMRADKQRNETKPTATESDKEFDVYLEKYMSANPRALILRAQPNGQIENEITKLEVNGGTGIEVVVHLLDVNPYSDYMIIKSGFASPESSGYRIIAPIGPDTAQKFSLFKTKELFIRFYFAKNPTSKNYKGYVITYQPIGEVSVTTTSVPDSVSAPVDGFHSIVVVLNVPKADRTDETWSKFRRLFATSTNLFTRANNISVEECKTENVTLVSISRCPIEWPNAQNCLKVRVAISLNTEKKPTYIDNSTGIATVQRMVTISPVPETDDDGAEMKPPPSEPELTNQHLREMWLQFGKTLFASAEIQEFELPDHREILALWTSVSLGVVIVFLLVLVAIWKMEVFQDYRRMSWKHSDDQQHIYKNHTDVDISMFPSPHQIVPSLFPGDVSTSYAGESMRTGLPFEYASQPISFNESDFKRRSLNETMQNERDGVEVPFQPDIIDFNEPQSHHKIYLPDDDIDFNTPNGAPMSKQQQNAAA